MLLVVTKDIAKMGTQKSQESAVQIADKMSCKLAVIKFRITALDE